MKIKSQKNKKFINIFYKTYFIVTLVAFMIGLFILTNLDVWEKNKDEFKKRIYLNGISNYQHLPKIFYLLYKNSFAKLEDFNLEIDQKNIIIIENNRKQKNIDVNHNFIDAKASINYKGKKIKTKIRLKGDRKVHYENKNKSSYKLNIRNKNVYKSLSSFSIQKPRIRNYIHEWIFHELAKEIGLISLDYDFVKLKINGENKGLFVIEESFSNTLLEKNNRRAGPIFGLNEEFEMGNFFEAKLDPYQLKYWLKPENINLYLLAKNKLSSLQNRSMELNEVIDLQKWSDYFVLCDLLFTHHGLLPKSVKFYYNPITGLFEPIPFDGHKMPSYDYSPKIEKYFNQNTTFDVANLNVFEQVDEKNFSKWLKLFFYKKNGKLNDEFYLAYQNSIKKINNTNLIESFLKRNQDFIDKINTKIYLDDFQFDYPTDRKKGLGIYYFDSKKIIERINIINKKNKIILSSIVIDDFDNTILISNKNYINNKLKIKKILCKKINAENEFFYKDINYRIKFNKNSLQKKEIGLSNTICTKAILIDTSNNEEYQKKIDENLFYKFKKKEKKYFNNYFVKKDNFLYPKFNETIIDKNIYIPKNFRVIIKPNQIIRLINNAFIFSESCWFLDGSKQEPILISGYHDNYGGGIFISSDENNFFNNIKLEYLNGPDIKTKINNENNLSEHRIYGALNFFKTKVEISNLYFSNISSEDALNIIKSNFIIKDSYFSNIASDAIDFDYSNGKINNIFFENIVDDALDFSGSKVDVQKINARLVGDKVISAGENSQLNINDLKIYDSFIGIANKDGSLLTLKKGDFDRVKIPLASFSKKNFYKNSHMSVIDSIFKNYESEYILSKGSVIIMNNKKLSKNKKNKDILDIVY